MAECVCGFNPPIDPNPDCERCQLVCEVDRLFEGRKAEQIKCGELQAEVERMREEYPYGEADMDLKDDEIVRLKGIITDVGSSGIERECDKYTVVQVYSETWKECYQMALDEIEQDAREQQTA